MIVTCILVHAAGTRNFDGPTRIFTLRNDPFATTLRVCLSMLELGVAVRLTEVGGKQMR